MSALGDWLRDDLAPRLRELLAPLDGWLAAQPPTVWRLSAVALIVVGSLWVVFVPRRFVLRGAPDERPWRDLRFWAVLVALPYALIYLLLG